MIPDTEMLDMGMQARRLLDMGILDTRMLDTVMRTRRVSPRREDTKTAWGGGIEMRRSTTANDLVIVSAFLNSSP